MNDIVKNTELFVSILGMSRTSAVQKWDHEAFQRAFRWAHYFEQVHKKTKSKQHVVDKISLHLSEACAQVDAKLGLSPLLYSDLPNSTNILRKNLLENASITNDFYLQLVEQFNAQAEGEETIKSQLHSLSKLKATLQILQLIQKRFELLSTNDSTIATGDGGETTTSTTTTVTKTSTATNTEPDKIPEVAVRPPVPPGQPQDPRIRGVPKQQKAPAVVPRPAPTAVATTATTATSTKDRENKSSVVKSQITANAVLLRKCLQNVINQAPSLCSEKKSQLHEKLSNIEKHERGVDVLLLALICDESDDRVSRYIVQFIRDVLVEKWKLGWKLFLQLPLSKLFAQSATLYKDFMEIYLDLLHHCGEMLQLEVSRNGYLLVMEKVETNTDHQMCKYYYYLLQNFLITLAQLSAPNEITVEMLIRDNCANLVEEIEPEANVWKKLSQDMMVASTM